MKVLCIHFSGCSKLWLVLRLRENVFTRQNRMTKLELAYCLAECCCSPGSQYFAGERPFSTKEVGVAMMQAFPSSYSRWLNLHWWEFFWFWLLLFSVICLKCCMKKAVQVELQQTGIKWNTRRDVFYASSILLGYKQPWKVAPWSTQYLTCWLICYLFL